MQIEDQQKSGIVLRKYPSSLRFSLQKQRKIQPYSVRFSCKIERKTPECRPKYLSYLQI